MIDASTGSGSSSISSSNNNIKIVIDGKRFQSNDTRGPFVIIPDGSGNLTRRDFLPEDEKEFEQIMIANEQRRILREKERQEREQRRQREREERQRERENRRNRWQ